MSEVEVEFIYQQNKTIIQANLNNSLEVVINQFINLIKLDINKIYFVSNDKIISKNDIISNIMNESERLNKKLKISVYNINNAMNIANNTIIKSKRIICPHCKESCKYNIKDYRIKLYDCKNKHIIEKLKLSEFINTQNVDISKIKCDICEIKNKSNTINNEFYICYECDINLCPSCKTYHDQTHSIINDDLRNFICNKHKEVLIKYCNDCNIDICKGCLNEHKYHNLISYKDKLIDIKNLRKKINELRNIINIYKTNLEGVIRKIKAIIENIDIYYSINNDILNYYENTRNININMLINLKNINDSVNNEIKKIKYNYNYGLNLNYILYLYSEMNSENIEIEMKYEPKARNKDKIRIFGNTFINNNIQKCKIIYKEKEYDLVAYFEDIDGFYNNKETIEFKLKGINNISDMSSLFDNCKSLYFLPNISRWNTSNITNMNKLFFRCDSLLSISDISKWNISKVIDISDFFSCCNSLEYLPDLSKWNTSSVFDMNSIFSFCHSLSSLPDISKWNTSNVNDMNNMFSGCEELTSLPDISKWNTSNVINMSSMFNRCKSLKKLPDISKWDTSNVTDMSYMFCECISLVSLPDLLTWNISKVRKMYSIFESCSILLNIPSKFKK